MRQLKPCFIVFLFYIPSNTSLIHCHYPTENIVGTSNSLGYFPQFPALVYSSLFSWTYSNPKPLFKRLANERTALIRRLCHDQHQAAQGIQKKAQRTIFGLPLPTSSSSTSPHVNPHDESRPLDVVIQIRTFRDTPKNQGKDDFFTQNDQILGSFRTCALQGTMAAVQRIMEHNGGHDNPSVNVKQRQPQKKYSHQPQQNSVAPICVYVTSDSTAVADDVRNYLVNHINAHHSPQSKGDGNGGGIGSSTRGGSAGRGSGSAGSGTGRGGPFFSVVSSSDLTRLGPHHAPYTKPSSIPSTASSSSTSTSLSDAQPHRTIKATLRSDNEQWHSMEVMKRFQSQVLLRYSSLYHTLSSHHSTSHTFTLITHLNTHLSSHTL